MSEVSKPKELITLPSRRLKLARKRRTPHLKSVLSGNTIRRPIGALSKLPDAAPYQLQPYNNTFATNSSAISRRSLPPVSSTRALAS